VLCYLTTSYFQGSSSSLTLTPLSPISILWRLSRESRAFRETQARCQRLEHLRTRVISVSWTMQAWSGGGDVPEAQTKLSPAFCPSSHDP